MDALFKNVQHTGDAFRGYELKTVLSYGGWDAKIPTMFVSLDLKAVHKCWTSILFELPITIVGIAMKTSDQVILSDFRELDALMNIYGITQREKLYVDPRSSNLSLLPKKIAVGPDGPEEHLPLEDVCDTFKLIGRIDEIKKWNIPDADKEEYIDNLRVINAKMQQFVITVRELQIDPGKRDKLACYLNTFYGN